MPDPVERLLARIGVGILLLGVLVFCAAFLSGCVGEYNSSVDAKYHIIVPRGNTWDIYATDSLLQVENCVRFVGKESGKSYEVCGSYTIEYLKPE